MSCVPLWKRWGRQYDNRSKQSKNIPAARDNGHAESGERADGNSTGVHAAGSVQRERVCVLRAGPEAAEGGVLGQDRLLAQPEKAGKGPFPVAAGRGGSAGTD